MLVVKRFADGNQDRPKVAFRDISKNERIDCEIGDSVSPVESASTRRLNNPEAMVELPSIDGLQEAADIQGSNVSTMELSDRALGAGIFGFGFLSIAGLGGLLVGRIRDSRRG